MPEFSGLSHIGQVALTVHDLDRATAFYREILGLPYLFSAPPGLAFFACAGTRLMLSQPEHAAGDRTGTMLYFAVDDIQAAHEALSGRGVTFQQQPHMIARLSDREVWLAVFADTEGNTLALMSEPAV
jgi:methylmalonyl-CoA/ethylmalonyl-CoA epimerase